MWIAGSFFATHRVLPLQSLDNQLLHKSLVVPSLMMVSSVVDLVLARALATRTAVLIRSRMHDVIQEANKSF